MLQPLLFGSINVALRLAASPSPRYRKGRLDLSMCSWPLPCAEHKIVSVVTMDESSIVVDPPVQRTNDIRVFMTRQQLCETDSEMIRVINIMNYYA